jgi:hypothetical protein
MAASTSAARGAADEPPPSPAASRDDAAPWERTLYAFLGEKERRSGSKRTVDSYGRLLWLERARRDSNPRPSDPKSDALIR